MKKKVTDVWQLFRTTYVKSQRFSEEFLRNYGLTPSQFVIMNTLQSEKELPMSDVSKVSACVNSNITSIVGRMEDKGLVVRRADTKDRRVVYLSITEEGRALYKKAKSQYNKSAKLIFGEFTLEELETFAEMLEKMNLNLDA